MIVVGGLYDERCAVPGDRRPRGSGLRAAAALRRLDDEPLLVSAVEKDGRPAAEAAASGLGVKLRAVQRSERIRFSYFTPLSAPLIDGSMSRAVEPIAVEDRVVLVFGMVEAPLGEIHVAANRIIVDPQQPRNLVALDLTSFQWDHLAIVANGAETIALGGEPDIRASARALLRQYGADVVVTKWGARGSLVTHADGQDMVGPFPTRAVWPIGTGDVFAAGFAWAWGQQEISPVEAARFAGRAVAAWTERHEEEPSIDPGTLDRYAELTPSKDPSIYLAAPFFDLGQRWFVELVKESAEGIGAEVFSPLHAVGLGGPEVAAKDLAGLSDSGAVLAWLDGNDPGTLFEVGYAISRGIPVVGYLSGERTRQHNMLLGTGAELHADLSTAVYRSIWASMGYALDPA